MPHLVQVANEFAAKGGRVLAISQDLFVPDVDQATAVERVKNLAEALEMRFPILVLSDRNLDALNDHFDLPGPIPCTLALDATGKEVDREEGSADLERFRAMMQRALQ